MAAIKWTSSGFRAWEFSWRSIPRAYARAFLRGAILPHPWQALRGFLAYFSLPRREGHITSFFREETAFLRRAAEGKLLVGMGFCQKPLSECPSGRFNHDCLYLNSQSPEGDMPSPCRGCAIFLTGKLTLKAGGSLYIMTSALDIAKDAFIPASNKEFTQAIFCVCPYSMEPIVLAALMCGLEGIVISYAEGACASYSQWLQADRGIKKERTFLSEEGYAFLEKTLNAIASARKEANLSLPSRFKREGNIYRCQCVIFPLSNV